MIAVKSLIDQLLATGYFIIVDIAIDEEGVNRIVEKITSSIHTLVLSRSSFI